MTGQAWLADTFAGLMVVTAGYCLARLVISWRQRRRTDRRVDAVHVLMSVAMAGMLVPALRVFWTGGWEIIFGAATLWFGWLAMREYRARAALGRFRPHHAQHALHCAAMVYMFAAVGTGAAVASGSGMGGMGAGAHYRTLALILALAIFGYVIWTADRLPGLARVPVLAAQAAVALSGPVPAGSVPTVGLAGSAAGDPCGSPADAPAAARRYSGPPLSPRLAACCEIALGVTMGYALILML